MSRQLYLDTTDSQRFVEVLSWQGKEALCKVYFKNGSGALLNFAGKTTIAASLFEPPATRPINLRIGFITVAPGA